MPGQDVLKTIAKLPSTSSYTELLQTGLDLLKKTDFQLCFWFYLFFFINGESVMQNFPKKKLAVLDIC